MTRVQQHAVLALVLVLAELQLCFWCWCQFELQNLFVLPCWLPGTMMYQVYEFVLRTSAFVPSFGGVQQLYALDIMGQYCSVAYRGRLLR